MCITLMSVPPGDLFLDLVLVHLSSSSSVMGAATVLASPAYLGWSMIGMVAPVLGCLVVLNLKAENTLCMCLSVVFMLKGLLILHLPDLTLAVPACSLSLVSLPARSRAVIGCGILYLWEVCQLRWFRPNACFMWSSTASVTSASVFNNRSSVLPVLVPGSQSASYVPSSCLHFIVPFVSPCSV